jgi:phosphoglycerate dehydrogenase-like enzyme
VGSPRTVAIPDRPDLRAAVSAPADAHLAWVGEDEASWGPASEAQMLVAHPAFGRDRTQALMERMPDLRVVQAITAGVDWIQPVIPDGVVLCDGQGVHDVGVAEWTVAMLLAIVRELPALVGWQSGGRWDGATRFGSYGELHDSTVLLLGYGSIGRAVEERLAPFGADIVRVARRAREGTYGAADLDGLLGDADAVVLLLPMTPETRGLVDDAFLGRMKPGSVLVNAARGPIVETAALLRALESGRLSAAGLDVTDPEPLPDGHPLWTATGAFITPHVATKTVRLYQRIGELITQQIERYTRGDRLANVVDGEY